MDEEAAEREGDAVHEQEDRPHDRGLTIAEQQAWCVIERRLVAEGVTGADEILAFDVARMRRHAAHAMTDSVIALVLGVGFLVLGLRLVGLPLTAIAIVGLSLGLGVVLATALLRLLGGLPRHA
jgi:uncharacterized membrane protein